MSMVMDVNVVENRVLNVPYQIADGVVRSYIGEVNKMKPTKEWISFFNWWIDSFKSIGLFMVTFLIGITFLILLIPAIILWIPTLGHSWKAIYWWYLKVDKIINRLVGNYETKGGE